MTSPIHSSNGPLPPGSVVNTSNVLPSTGSSATNHQSQNAVRGSLNNNSRVHPPMHERSRNARAQARHRAKRKAYIEQLEETVNRLQAALSPYPPFNTPPTGVNGSANANANEQTQSGFGVSLSSPGSVPNSSGNAQIGIGPPSASGQGQGSGGPVLDAGLMQVRLRALELECNALRAYAGNLRGMLTQHAPTLQIPPEPLPSSLPPSAMASATSSVPPSLHHSANSTSSPNPGAEANGTRPSLNSSFPSFSSTTSTMSYGLEACKTEPGRVAGAKRPRRDSDSPPLSGGGPEAGERLRMSTNGGGNVGYSTPNPTPPLNHKPSASSNPNYVNAPNTGMNMGRPGVPPLTLPPVSQTQPNAGHPSSVHSHTHPTPPSAYSLGSTQSQQPLPSPVHQQPTSQHQPQTPSHSHAQTQPPSIAPMPPPIPWNGTSSVLSHGNNNALAHGLQLPPPIPRYPGTSMPNLTRSFAYSLSTPTTSTTRHDGMDDGVNADRSRIGSLSGSGTGTGLGNAAGGMPLKREEDCDPGLAGVYSAIGTEDIHTQPQTQRRAPGRHQQHDSLNSISPTSATAQSPAIGNTSTTQHHTQIPSPHAHQQGYQQQPPPTMQRVLPSPSSYQHQHQSQPHYHHPSNQHQPIQTHQHHQMQHQQSTAALPSPHSPYSPLGPNMPGPYRGYQEERYNQTVQQPPHAHPQTQSQNHDQNYMWSPAQHGTMYGGR